MSKAGKEVPEDVTGMSVYKIANKIISGALSHLNLLATSHTAVGSTGNSNLDKEIIRIFNIY